MSKGDKNYTAIFYPLDKRQEFDLMEEGHRYIEDMMKSYIKYLTEE